MLTCCCCEEKTDVFFNLQKWFTVSGDWSAGGGVLQGTGPGLLNFWYDAPGDDPVRARIKLALAPSYGDCWRMLAGYVDVDNYHFAEIKTESSSGAKDGYFGIGSRIAGEETMEKWKFQTGILTEQQITVCYRDDLTPPRLVAYYGIKNGLAANIRNFMREVPATGGRHTGLQIVEGNATFEEWSVDCTPVNPLDCGEQAAAGAQYPGRILSGSDDADCLASGNLRIYQNIHNRGASSYCAYGQFGIAVFSPSFEWKFGKRAYLCFRLLDAENYCFVRFTFVQSGANGFFVADIGYVEAGAETIINTATGPSIALADFTDTTPQYSISVQGDGVEVQLGGYAVGGNFSVTGALPTIDGDSWHFARGVGSLLDSPGEIVVEYSAHGLDESTPWDNGCIGCGI